MNQEILARPMMIGNEENAEIKGAWRSYLPAVLAVVGSVVMVAARIAVGGERFMSDGALMMLALACYLTAEIFYLTNF